MPSSTAVNASKGYHAEANEGQSSRDAIRPAIANSLQQFAQCSQGIPVLFSLLMYNNLALML